MINIHNKGFTLVECLISMLIMTILLAGGMSFYFYANEQNTLAAHKELMLALANSKMEEWKSTDYNTLRNHALVENTIPVTGGLIATVKSQFTNLERPSDHKEYIEVLVTLTWKEANKASEEEIALTTQVLQ